MKHFDDLKYIDYVIKFTMVRKAHSSSVGGM
jgi:hypothetical protein